MTGPEHYAEAERLLEVGLESGSDRALAAAQVHATLALAAATVADRVIGPQQAWGGHSVEVNHEEWEVLR